MKRRDLLAGLLPVAMAPLARAQQPGKMYRIALVVRSTPLSLLSEHGGSRVWQALFQELRRHGYEEGRNLTVERYSSEGREEIWPQLVKQIVATQPDLIFYAGTPVDLAKAAAGRVPIVGLVNDPVASGLSTSLSRPSANVTGTVGDMRVVGAKQLQMLREVRPGANHVAMLMPERHWEDYAGADGRMISGDRLQVPMYQQHGMRLTCLCVANPVQEPAYRHVFANLDHDRPDFIILNPSNENAAYRKLIVSVVNEKRIPALYPERQYVELGGLMSYAYDDEIWRHAARQMSEILRGRPVSEVPFYMPTKWELAINLRTAKAIGLEFPPSILLRADLVIE
jgi:putative ABC transport system substrate-binding protein